MSVRLMGPPRPPSPGGGSMEGGAVHHQPRSPDRLSQRAAGKVPVLPGKGTLLLPCWTASKSAPVSPAGRHCRGPPRLCTIRTFSDDPAQKLTRRVHKNTPVKDCLPAPSRRPLPSTLWPHCPCTSAPGLAYPVTWTPSWADMAPLAPAHPPPPSRPYHYSSGHQLIYSSVFEFPGCPLAHSLHAH